MLVPNVDIKEFEKIGFKPCRGTAGRSGCYYLCVSRGVKILFVSPYIFDVQNWESDDKRIHKKANCKYRDHRTAMDIVYQLIKANMLKGDWEE